MFSQNTSQDPLWTYNVMRLMLDFSIVFLKSMMVRLFILCFKYRKIFKNSKRQMNFSYKNLYISKKSPRFATFKYMERRKRKVQRRLFELVLLFDVMLR
jgi:hypothetical protein